MHSYRAKQIIGSPKTHEVLYNGIPVWLEDIDPAHGTAVAKTDIEPFIVPLEELEG